MFSARRLPPPPIPPAVSELINDGFDALGKVFGSDSKESKMTPDERTAEMSNCGTQINLIDIELRDLQEKMDRLKKQRTDLLHKEHKLLQDPYPELQELLTEIFPLDYKLECSKNIKDKSCVISISTTDQSCELVSKISSLFSSFLSPGEYMGAQPPTDLRYGYSLETSYAIKIYCNDRAKVEDGLKILKAKKIPSPSTISIAAP